jgi:2-iminobutanoate/2-iminopropanoate deaminase
MTRGTMPRTFIHTDGAPRAIGPYCQAVLERRGGTETLYCAGQIALDPSTMEIVPGDARAHTDRVMRNIAAVLEAAGMRFADAVRATIYVTDLADLPAVNEVYGAFFGGAAPPRSTVQVAGIPRGSRVEIEVTAVREAHAARGGRRRSVRPRSRGAVGGSTRG